MIIVPGPASQSLGKKVAESLDARVVSVNAKVFPDGEYALRFEGEISGNEVIVIQTTGPPQGKHIMELLLMLDAAKDLGAKKVTAVVPYLAFRDRINGFWVAKRSASKLSLNSSKHVELTDS